MFEFGRELRRIFGQDTQSETHAALMELLDVQLLRREADAADVAAGRVHATDRSDRSADAAMLRRELARRTGEAETLRKAASAAEYAARHANGDRRRASRARREQGLTALCGADLFGDPALARAAREALQDALAKADTEAGKARASAGLAGLQSRRALAEGDFEAALEAAAALDQAIHALDALTLSKQICRTEAASLRCDRADLLAGFGVRLREVRLLEKVDGEMKQLVANLDPAYEPLTWSRAQELRGSALVSSGELSGDVQQIAQGIKLLVEAVEYIPEDHSPLDWARVQQALGCALQALGEASDSEAALDQAQACFDRSIRVYDRRPALAARATAANNRAACLARRAERRGDLATLAQAESAFKAELVNGPARNDPLAWAVAQMNLARIYEARDEIRGLGEEREAALLALSEALEIFVERGLKSLAESASAGVERLRAPERATR
ncbi:MAG TPA: hypothetical protein VF699_08685 [Caulobacteraceae bacterium]